MSGRAKSGAEPASGRLDKGRVRIRFWRRDIEKRRTGARCAPGWVRTAERGGVYLHLLWNSSPKQGGKP
jgi:hypothetical protein